MTMNINDRLQQRNEEIGHILQAAREQQHRSVTECAMVLGTSRRRYRAIENGEVAVNLAEFEVLIQYLQLPIENFFAISETASDTRKVVVYAQLGETLQLEIKVPKNGGALPESQPRALSQ